MTIHSDHPFLPPDGDRSPVRRLRGRLPAPVTIWTSGEGRARAGWTVSSVLLADGDPAEVVALLDPDSDLADTIDDTGTWVVNLLNWEQRQLADPFAGTAPAPGGPFRLAGWTDSQWGPVLTECPGWLGVRLRPVTGADDTAGWARLIRGVVEHAEVGPDAPSLAHLRGRYRRLDPS